MYAGFINQGVGRQTRCTYAYLAYLYIRSQLQAIENKSSASNIFPRFSQDKLSVVGMANEENKRVGDACLENLSLEFSQDWQKIGRKLGLRDSELQNLRKDNFQKQEDINYEMLKLWRKKNGNKATYLVLEAALQGAERSDLAADLMDGRFDGGKESDNIPQADSKTNSGPADSRAVSSDAPTPAALARVNLPRYDMKGDYRGKCLILTYDEFRFYDQAKMEYVLDEEWKRSGNDNDEKRLYEVFENIGFDVDYETNLTGVRTKEIIKKMAEKTEFRSFVLFVCSHGEKEGFYTSDGELIKFQEDVIKPFKRINCHGFASKPKLFFFNSCRGEAEDEMVKYKKDYRPISTERGVVANTSTYRPNEADFCIVFSTVYGYVSWRNDENGSYFVQNLCDILEANYKTHHLFEILLISNNTLLEEFENSTKPSENKGEKPICQVPHLHSTLCKAVYFTNE